MIFRVEALCRSYRSRAFPLRAVDGLDLVLWRGETLALVGESGCGKSTLSRLLLRLERPDSGTIEYRGADLWGLTRAEIRQFRREVQLIFQDPYGSLDPRMRVEELLAEPLSVHRLSSGADRRRRIADLLAQVGLAPEAGTRLPHELSGGQRQRIGIARALAVDPLVLLADEPVSALDVSVQAQILNLLLELKERRELTLLFISHDLRVVRHISDRIAVMYRGRIVEVGEASALFESPLHPYTERLRRAVPAVGLPFRGNSPPPLEADESEAPAPGGCPYAPRCPEAVALCRQSAPRLESLSSDRSVACHLRTTP